MEQGSWRPLFMRDGQGETEFDVLHEGVPEWLSASIWRWLMDRAAEGGQALIFRLERRLRIKIAEAKDRRIGTSHTAPNQFLDRFWQAGSDDDRLVLVDAILYDMQLRAREGFDTDEQAMAAQLVDGAQRLGEILAEGGSAWAVHVEAPAWCLARRVDLATAQLVERVTSPGTDASRKIRTAWQACYRHDPDPDTAYRNAVLAVEAVAIPLTLPNATKATLGTVLANLRDTLPQWSVGGLVSEQIASGETLHSMLRTLWHNQERHARADGTIVDVTQAEAEAAVSLAVVLIHWFTSGLVVKADLA